MLVSSSMFVCSDPEVKVRLHDGEGGVYVWVANPTRQQRPVRLRLQGRYARLAPTAVLWGAGADLEGDEIVLTAAVRDVSVLALR